MRVFVNCKKLSSETPITDPSYVGSYTFFDHNVNPQPNARNHGDGTLSFVMKCKSRFRQALRRSPIRAK